MKAFEEKKLPTMKIGRYFDMFLMVSRQGDTQMISELPEALNVVINVPDDLRADGREFYILRLHTKEDDSMEYAELADEKGASKPTGTTADNRQIVNVIIITCVISVAAMVLFTLLYGRNRKERQAGFV